MSDSVVKVTKRERYESIKALCDVAGDVGDIDVAGTKRAEGDELTEVVYNVLTDEPAPIDEIVARIGSEDVTKGKVTYRLTSLVKAGRAVKTEASMPGADGKARKVSVYAIA